MPVISITRLRLRSWRFIPAFLVYAMRSSRQARRSEGNLGTGVLNDANKTFWTRSAWKDEAALKAFLIAQPHLTAMKKLPYWCDEAAIVHWVQETAALPDWKEACHRMRAEGRPSKVTFPSADHQALRFPEPRG
jgi:hypothetical protein